MKFEEMSELQKKLHNAAIVIEADGDEYGHAQLLIEAINEIEKQNNRFDSGYIAGLNAGWNFCSNNDSAGLERAVNVRIAPNATVRGCPLIAYNEAQNL